MTESLEPIERTPTAKTSDRVNPTDRSNPEKKDNGFSNALKEKMKEQLKKKAQIDDEVILENEPEEDEKPEPQPDDEVILENEPEEDEKPEPQQAQAADAVDLEPDVEDEAGSDLPDHVDLKA